MTNLIYANSITQRENFIQKATTYQSPLTKFWQSLFVQEQIYTQMIDISSHNFVAIEDWQILKDAGVKGVYIRYFIGDRLDTEFDAHLSRAVDIGIECIGAYGVPFDHLSPGIAVENFGNAEFKINTKTDGYYLPSWNDIELTYVDTVSERINFHQAIFDSFPGIEIYSAAWFWDQYLPNERFPGVKKTVANYTSANTPCLPRNWDEKDLVGWQYNIWKKYPWHDISFSPIPYALDQDRFYGTEDELKTKTGYVINPPSDLKERVTELEEGIETMNKRIHHFEMSYLDHEHGKPK